MKLLFLLLLLASAFSTFSQIGGTWQGLMIRNGQAAAQGTIVYLELDPKTGDPLRSREEVTGKDAYAVRKLKGSATGKSLSFEQGVIVKKKDLSGNRWCAISATLTFNDSTGYLEGSFTTTECRGVSGRIVLYRSREQFPTENTIKEYQSWRPIFAEDLRLGRKSPEVRELERKNFRFQPIYFDHDEAVIKPEFSDFLLSMVRVVNSHSDLRIMVTGHTDSDGSDSYNVDLSRRRAEAIIAFFVSAGLSRDRIRIEFKGEADPVGDNKTREGKQLNRRVDFAFI